MSDKYNQKWVHQWINWDSPHCAITIGQITYYADSKEYIDALPEARRHEEKHKEQWKKYGYIGFSIRWIYQLLKYGYENAPLEIEAREAENEKI